MIYSFNSFTVNTDDYLFTDEGDKKSLEPRVFDVLIYLIENRDRIVTKDELIEKLWSGRVITDSALNTCIRSIRKALGDSREKQMYIRTFPKRGFQFIAKVETSKGCIGEDIPENMNPGVIQGTGNKPPLKIFLVAILLVVLFGYGLMSWNERKIEKPLSQMPVIAVLDFKLLFPMKIKCTSRKA